MSLTSRRVVPAPGRRKRPTLYSLAVALVSAVPLLLGIIGSPAQADTMPGASATTTAVAGYETLWGESTDAAFYISSDREKVELGTAFSVKTNGTVAGVRFYKSQKDTGSHSGTLWSATGTRLATVTFRNESASGWQTAIFNKPVSVLAGQRYVVSYSSNGYYPVSKGFSGGTDALNLDVPRGNSGVYAYGSGSPFPKSTWQSSQYWVDVLFTAGQAAPPAAPPTPTPTPPATNDFPSAKTTGVPTGVTLTPYNGPSRITSPGTVIDSKLITTPIVITANAHNVTIINSKIQTSGFFLVLNDEGAQNLRIIDTELDGRDNTSNDSAVGGRNYTLTRVNIHSTVDGVKLGNNVTIKDSYIHDLVTSSGSHNDGMQSLGSNNVVLQHNTVIVPPGSTSAIILSTGSATSMKNILIERNLLGGGAYTVYGGYQSGVDVLSRVGDVTISNNRITTAISPNGGTYGPFASVDKPAVTLSGNVWHDGARAGKAIP